MIERSYEVVRCLPREDLEEFAVRTALQVRMERVESSSGDYFVAVIIGFMLGALVATSGFLVGTGIG